jgi:hypothetical protein
MTMPLSPALMLLALVAFLGCRDAAAQAPAQAACARLVSLCGGNDHDRQECERSFRELRPTVDPQNAARAARCLAESNTCAEGTGCMAGAAMRAGASMLRDFTYGFTR